jgi:hypothetical protein
MLRVRDRPWLMEGRARSRHPGLHVSDHLLDLGCATPATISGRRCGTRRNLSDGTRAFPDRPFDRSVLDVVAPANGLETTERRVQGLHFIHEARLTQGRTARSEQETANREQSDRRAQRKGPAHEKLTSRALLPPGFIGGRRCRRRMRGRADGGRSRNRDRAPLPRWLPRRDRGRHRFAYAGPSGRLVTARRGSGKIQARQLAGERNHPACRALPSILRLVHVALMVTRCCRISRASNGISPDCWR